MMYFYKLSVHLNNIKQSKIKKIKIKNKHIKNKILYKIVAEL